MTAAPARHRLHEDVQAVLLAALVMALGLTLYAEAMLVTGGMAGLALLLHHAAGLGFGMLLVLVNLPFFALALWRMGWQVALRSLCAVLLVSGFAAMTPGWLGPLRPEGLYAAVTGGALLGIGLLMLFRHRTGVGGSNILAMWLQERHGIRAGRVLMAIDAAILLAACLVVPWEKVALSLAGTVVLNAIVALNHRPGRYLATS